jgi:hypothetical protein
MDLTAALLHAAARRPHVLVVPALGGTAVRFRLEAELAQRGWPQATAPADTDVLVLAGAPGPALMAVVDEVWLHVPAPRARTTIADPDLVPTALDEAALLLADGAHQRNSAPPTASPAPDAAPDAAGKGGELSTLIHRSVSSNSHVPSESHESESGHGDHDADHAGHGGEHGGHGESHGGHHDHHGGGMDLPGALTMAALGADRDGLTLDQLHVPLGPLLPDWPTGLVLHVTLQGDVIQEATAEVLDREHRQAFWRPGDAAARELDGLARFLAVAGWADAADRTRAVRDRLLADGTTDEATERAVALVRRVRRSRTLRWSVRGIAAGGADVAALLGQRLDAVEAALRGDGAGVVRLAAEDLPELLVGVELAAARLVVAVLDPDTGSTAVADAVPHG